MRTRVVFEFDTLIQGTRDANCSIVRLEMSVRTRTGRPLTVNIILHLLAFVVKLVFFNVCFLERRKKTRSENFRSGENKCGNLGSRPPPAFETLFDLNS